MNVATRLAASLLVLVGIGCSATAPRPPSWDAPNTSADWCARPQGSFANLPVRRDEADSPTLELQQLFFGNTLNGFDVSHLSVDTDDMGVVTIRPWVGDRVLQERVELRRRQPCTDAAWRHHPERTATPEGALAGLLWTGGIVVPMFSGATFDLAVTTGGDLAVHVTRHTSGTAFLFFPMRVVDADDWFLFPRWTGAVAADPSAARQSPDAALEASP